MHGTGHGVGAFLNVHEGPHMITMRVGRGDYPLDEHMLVSNGMIALDDLEKKGGSAADFLAKIVANGLYCILAMAEPGYYEAGKFGIRIENVVAIVKANTEFNFGGRTYYTFDNLTMVCYMSILFCEIYVKYMFCFVALHHTTYLYCAYIGVIYPHVLCCRLRSSPS